MQVETGVSIHNKFEIVVRNAETGEVEQRGQAENIVVDRMYERLCNFNTYFNNIVFGTGEGTPTPSRRTLFNRIGYKSGVTESLVRAYPTSTWVQSIRLGTDEYNGNIITEIGISDTTTEVNTHAMITDSEGNPLSVEKTELRIIDLYATVFINVYDVDSGLFFYEDNLRNYLTGGASPNNTLGISNLEVAGINTITGTRTADVPNKSVKATGRFNINNLNKDVKYLYWTGLGLACKIPRPEVFEGKQITEDNIGVGDGINKEFHLGRSSNTPIEDLIIYVGGVVVDFIYDNLTNIVTIATPPADTVPITASYKTLYIPKTVNNILDTTFKIKFGVTQPTPVVSEPPAVIPGATTPIAGDVNYGFFGEVYCEDLINGEYLATRLRLTGGTAQHTDAPWLKFTLDGKTLFVAKKTLRHSISWDQINNVDAVYGCRTIDIKGHTYKVRLLKTGTEDPMSSTSGTVLHGSEWNRLMLPIHEKAKGGSWAYPNNVKDGTPYWGIDYTDEDLLTHNSFGNGSYSWCQESSSSSHRLFRGNYGVSYSFGNSSSSAHALSGWRPVLELVA